MIPIRDNIPTRSFPIMTVTIIVLNVIVFLFELVSMQNSDQVFYSYGLIPCALTNHCAPLPGALPAWATVFTAMFMHAGWLHIAGNMLYLWIFGNNIEDVMGPVGFVVFYLLCGVAASFAQIAIDPGSTIVNVGASGAIAGVLGAYLVLFPRARIDTLLLLGWFARLVALPAIIVLGGWFVLQLFSGALSLGGPSNGGVAFFAHVGGFVAGMVLVFLFRRRDPVPYA